MIPFALGLVAGGLGVAVLGWLRWRPAPRVRFEDPGAPAPDHHPDPSTGAHPRAGAVVELEVVPRRRLPTFANVGGMEALKQEIRDTLGLLLEHPKRAAKYKISWNGLLFHGPPGCGKSFFVRAVAGELGLNLIAISTGDLVTEVPGEGPSRVVRAFEFASQHRPCVLFFDELDAVARDRGEGGDHTGREIVTQLLQSVEEWRSTPDLIVAAATNDLDALDPAVVRPGRFDRHVRLDLPDHDARRAILAAALAGRPNAGDLDLDAMARRTPGRTPAVLVQLVDLAALLAFRETCGRDVADRLTNAHLQQALEQSGGADRPGVESFGWDSLVLDDDTLAELQQVQALLEDPELAHRMGVEPPNGLLLTGPPGTGKTTVAKVLAAQARCSFYPASAAELSSRWVGESEKAISRLFRRARANAPSIVFLDEIDAIGASRGTWGAYDRQLDQLLQELDGMRSQPGVMLLAATNRPNALDPALLRGGRLSRVIELPLPDVAGRRRLLGLFTARMPLHKVDLDEMATDTDGFSGADLKALCQQAALEALVRDPTNTDVRSEDIRRALDAGLDTIGQRQASEPAVRRTRRRPLSAGG